MNLSKGWLGKSAPNTKGTSLKTCSNLKSNSNNTIALILICSFVLMAVGGRAQDANSGSITGEVIETWNNTPLPNVIVTVRGTTLATKTDREGSFIIKNVPAGQYTLVYSRSGYDRATIPDVRVLVGQKTGANARLAPRFTDMETYEVVAMQFDQQMIDLLGARSDAVGVMDSIGSDFFPERAPVMLVRS